MIDKPPVMPPAEGGSPPAGPHPYTGLTPDVVLDALDGAGFHGDGRLLSLNSYENRVYQVWLEEPPAQAPALPSAPPAAPVQSVASGSIVAKFYRPGRWTDAQIEEEHAFVAELAARELPVVAPLVLGGGRTLARHGGFRLAVYPRRGGRAPELEDPETLKWMGRFLGRIHAVGALRPFAARPALDIESFGYEPCEWLLENGFIPEDLEDAWTSIAQQALEGIENCFERAGDVALLRLHGDCHAGNVLWTERDEKANTGGPHFVDFDDARMGPAIQDLWMLVSGQQDVMARQFRDLLAGYEAFHDFNPAELHLVEALRTLRLLHYAAWIARRWEDPAFPAAFPWFNTQRYWQDRVLELREQVALMDEPPPRI